jgi:hypothetical protein
MQTQQCPFVAIAGEQKSCSTFAGELLAPAWLSWLSGETREAQAESRLIAVIKRKKRVGTFTPSGFAVLVCSHEHGVENCHYTDNDICALRNLKSFPREKFVELESILIFIEFLSLIPAVRRGVFETRNRLHINRTIGVHDIYAIPQKRFHFIAGT